MTLLGAISAFPLFARRSRAATTLAARLIVLADLHSAYERLGALLAAIQREVADHPVAHAIVINGDILESANVVTTRSNGAIDWAFLSALRKLAPVVLNLGNHEPDLENDLAAFVDTAREAGIIVVSNIIDARTGRPYADPATTLQIGPITASVAGIATNALATYPKATRELLEIPDPALWAMQNLGKVLAKGTLPVILSHAGVVADRAILDFVPDGALVVGGHDHLRFTHEKGLTRYVHTASWANAYTVVEIDSNRVLRLAQRTIDATTPAPPEFAALVEATMVAHLTPDETATVGISGKARTLAETGRAIAATMAAAAGADAGFIGHTTLGTGIPLGPVSRYAFDAIVRFDGKLMTADVDAATFAGIMARANQDADIPLGDRTGDFLYSAPQVAKLATVRIATNDWSAINQQKYFGRDDLVFTEVPDVRLKALVAGTLA